MKNGESGCEQCDNEEGKRLRRVGEGERERRRVKVNGGERENKKREAQIMKEKKRDEK